MATSFRLPDLGEGVHEAEVLSVQVKKGQNVVEGESILEVETDKAAVEIPSPFTGTVIEIHVSPGEMIKVGEEMITFSGVDAEKTAAKTPSLPQTLSSTIVPASPATRRLARELGVDLQLITPTGSNSVVTADDVRSFHEKNQQMLEPEPTTPPPKENSTGIEFTRPESLPDFSRWGEIEREPLRSIRRTTAHQMARAWSQIPHVTSQDTVDITRLEIFRKKHREEIQEAGGHLTLTVFALKAIATALKIYPHFNASLDLKSQEIIVKKYYNLGVAVDTDRGLIVPVIKDVDRKSIKEISIELHESVQKTRQGKIDRDHLQGGTFTITNAGAMGGGFFTPIINLPQVAILGLGQARMQPKAIEDDNGEYVIVPRLMMPIVLCFDHRVVDGADAIRFLRVVIDALEDPDELLITMI